MMFYKTECFQTLFGDKNTNFESLEEAICTIDLAQLQRELQGTGVQSTWRENQMLRRRVEWTRDRWGQA